LAKIWLLEHYWLEIAYQYDESSLNGFDELRDKIIRFIAGHTLHIYKSKKVAWGSYLERLLAK